MSWFDWLKQKLFGTPPTRDISRLDTETQADPDPVVEVVDTSGGPINPKHQRRALRDGRLLPKAKPPIRWGKKRDLLFPGYEARRLFSASLRTSDRGIRDLKSDNEQLARLSLPLWQTEEELASALGLTLKQLWFFGVHRQRERFPHYVTFAIPKRTGGERLIMAPKRKLKAIQRKLNDLVVSRLPLSEHAHAFRLAHSVKTGAEPHVGHKLVLRLDLKDFFPTVTFPRVRGMFIACGYSYPVATTLALLTTEAERQPVDLDGKMVHIPVGRRHCVQGAPTSPGICNAISRKLDNRLAGLARKFGCAYTRYADDLTFSGDIDRKQVVGLLHHAREIIKAEGFEVNEKKTRIQGSGGRQTVTGVVVNQTLGLSRKDRRNLRAAIHQIETGRNTDPAHRASVEGKLAYLQMLNRGQADALRKRLDPLT